MLRTIIIIYILAAAVYLSAENRYDLRGHVIDVSTAESIPFASIQIKPAEVYTTTDSNGNWQLSLTPGNYTLIISYIGYQSDTLIIAVPRTKELTIRLHERSKLLGEVEVTARESHGVTSSSRIDRSAMQHLQPTSFTDLLELLPGNISQNPDMSKANTITLRETGTISATGVKTDTNEDYTITSLGTAFIVDGAPMNNDALLQGVPTATSSDEDGERNITNKGVDMRTISTDNIESVEIVRGIPSAEYGNLTSGLVNIRRINRATPISARFKADGYSKLFSIGKGFNIGRQTINADGGYLDSRTDPRDIRENYRRINGSARAHLLLGGSESAVTANWTIASDWTGSYDNVKSDPDLNTNKIDYFESSYQRASFTSQLSLRLQKCRWLETINFNSSVSYQKDKLIRQKQVAPKRASVAPTSMAEGVNEGHYLLQEYVADFENDGRPLSLFLKLSAVGNFKRSILTHAYKAGVELSGTKNYGKGQIYDLTRPLGATWTTRPRKFSDIPALNIVSAYAEENLTAKIRETRIEIQAGLRTQSIVGLDSRYDLSGKLYIDPRLNAVVHIPAIDAGGVPLRMLIAGGYGVTTKMPTIDYLFPQVHYNDLIEMNYYDVGDPTANSRVILRTYIDSPVNYQLRPARNHKMEFRIGIDHGMNRMSVTWFTEKMRSGYRYSTVYNAYAMRRYDTSGIEPGTLTSPPDPGSLPFEDVSILDGYRKVTNGSRIDKQGIEYQISTARLKALNTSLIINGAWFRSRYSNSMHLFIPVSDVIGNTAVSDRYVGLYATDDGRINEQFNTNFMFDTQIPRWNLIFTTSVQCMWYIKTRRMRENGVPVQYLSAADGQLHPFTEADLNDVTLQYLIRSFNEMAYRTQRVPPAIFLNIKATKKIGRFLSLSAFVNRLFDYLPDYKSNGLSIRRTSNAYFGMEANLSF